MAAIITPAMTAPERPEMWVGAGDDVVGDDVVGDDGGGGGGDVGGASTLTVKAVNPISMYSWDDACWLEKLRWYYFASVSAVAVIFFSWVSILLWSCYIMNRVCNQDSYI